MPGIEKQNQLLIRLFSVTSLPLLFLLLAGQAGGVQTPAPQAPVAPSFGTALAIAEPIRLALTPTLDGKIEEEEWDPFFSVPGLTAYLGWEPDKIHVAAVVPNGQDAVVSMDLKSNGWLVGSDNVEVRVSNTGGKPTLVARLLDATNPAGPVFKPLTGMSADSVVSAVSDGTNTTYEFTISDANLGLLPDKWGSKLGIRMDAVPSASGPTEPVNARVMVLVTFMFERSAALPAGLKFKPEGAGRVVAPGENVRIRLTFEGDENSTAQRVELRTEGFARMATNLAQVPFPAFDKKHRAFIDYETGVAKDASVGYRLLRGTITGTDGVAGLTQTSFRVAPPLGVDLVREPVKVMAKIRLVRFAYYLKSNTLRRVKGSVDISSQAPIKINEGEHQTFGIYDPRGTARKVIEFEIPANTSGAFPIKFIVDMDGKKTEFMQYLNVG